MKHWLCALAVMIGGAAQAVELQLPANARQLIVRETVEDRYFAPIGPFQEGALPAQVFQGAIARSSWRIDLAGLTPLQVVTPLQDQLLAAGYQVVLDCADVACGGYDFRFATEVMPAPNMYVNIRNYHVLTAKRGTGESAEVVSIFASASSGVSFLQIIQVAPSADKNKIDAVAPPRAFADVVEPEGELAQQLLTYGRAVLGGLEFNSGTSDLGTGPFAALSDLAIALQEQPDLRVALVGHTDNIGGLEGNIQLSRNRANAVRNRLIDKYDVTPSRLEAQGMGYLAPFTTNLTKEGREENRRVEVILLAQ
ncbi:OmpA family protein [Sulfitobacter donghicola]|uniref:Cell envelope biogenesis protein OmpA n=1 Tax=Sulfitobacter donghicola DSW-25 = KCTC 12864 = JCM 14565 TaxID=1300350 RepID=A0A073IM87_9RHOB|nr:OmpA family protein [Sulfitobacter donghicola]KEJ90864.1 cell envelope biogenesis protein OmpA [Sulfitobacter donghicola DSW-25 = KCTC 12864 = JCM 14565]KIN68143.1 OmpA family domain protein [Sulfitobacter donghicola DSW-25 = KCTC 12864 = JCM 14565]